MAQWDYGCDHGPSHWATGYPAAGGKKQSPIDIKASEIHYDASLKITPLKLQYKPANDFSITNTGRSVMVSRKATEDHQLSGGPLEHNYRFAQFHFHWGKTSAAGSEHLVDGKAFPSELHLVHWNTELYSSAGEAAAGNKGLSVLGVFLEIGKENPNLKALATDHLPQVKNKEDKSVLSESLNLASLLPGNTKDYWTYDGSLTTPPCSESVTWIVFKEPISVSKEQMERFRSLKSCCHDNIVDNYRPVMPLNGRNVRASFD